MYRDIIKQSKDSFTNERESNLTAVISQLSKLGDVSCMVHYTLKLSSIFNFILFRINMIFQLLSNIIHMNLCITLLVY